jgi:quinoprotein glucose dehydrogenase
MKFLRNEGLFTPPSFEGSISIPGHNGGANFQTSRGRSHARRDVRVRESACRR